MLIFRPARIKELWMYSNPLAYFSYPVYFGCRGVVQNHWYSLVRAETLPSTRMPSIRGFYSETSDQSQEDFVQV